MTPQAPSGGPGPWDRGLQLERTTLAWVRTLLSLLVADVVLARLTAEHSTLVAFIMLAVPMPVMLYLLTALGARRNHIDRQLRQSLPLSDAWRFTSALTAAVVTIALLELVMVFVR